MRRKQSNHKMDESVKIGQSVEFFGRLFFYWRHSLIKKIATLYCKKKKFDQNFFWPNKKNILVKNNFGYEMFFGQKYLSQFFTQKSLFNKNCFWQNIFFVIFLTIFFFFFYQIVFWPKNIFLTIFIYFLLLPVQCFKS